MKKLFYSISTTLPKETNSPTKSTCIISKKILRTALINPDTKTIGLNGDIIAKKVFPLLRGHKIFISHSHRDEACAVKVAEFIKNKYQVNSFIDSRLWGNVYDLANEIISMNHEIGATIYRYDICESVFAHIFNMLNNALSEAMLQADIFVFLNTPTSTEKINNELWIASPWLYHELSFTSMLDSFQNSLVKNANAELLSESFPIFRKMPQNHLKKISLEDFQKKLPQLLAQH